jgi:hypothetical protein
LHGKRTHIHAIDSRKIETKFHEQFYTFAWSSVLILKLFFDLNKKFSPCPGFLNCEKENFLILMRLILHGSQARHHGEEVSQGEVQSLDEKKAPVPEKQFDQTDDSVNLEGLRRRKEGPT